MLTTLRLKVSRELRPRKASRRIPRSSTNTTTENSDTERPPICLGVVKPPISDTVLPRCSDAAQSPPDYNTLFTETAAVTTTEDRLSKTYFPRISVQFQSVCAEPFVVRPRKSLRSRYRQSIESLKYRSIGSCSKRPYSASNAIQQYELQADESSETSELQGSPPVFELEDSTMDLVNNYYLDVPYKELTKPNYASWERFNRRALSPLSTPVYSARPNSEESLLAAPGMTNRSLESSPISPATPSSATTQHVPGYNSSIVSPITVAPYQLFSSSAEKHVSSKDVAHYFDGHLPTWDENTSVKPTVVGPMDVPCDYYGSQEHALGLSPVQTSYIDAVEKVPSVIHHTPTLTSSAVDVRSVWNDSRGVSFHGNQRGNSRWYKKLSRAMHISGSVVQQNLPNLYAPSVNAETTKCENQGHCHPVVDVGACHEALFTAELASGRQRVLWPKACCSTCDQEFTGK